MSQPFLALPEALRPVAARPGKVWTEAERSDVVIWLNRREHLSRLLRFSAAHMSIVFSGTTAADAEDAWSKFCLTRLDKLIMHFDPAVSPFVPFLLMALGRACRREGRRRRFESDQIRLARAGDLPPGLGPGMNDDPERAVERREAALRLRACVAELPSGYRTLVVQHYFGGRLVQEVAGHMGITEDTAKVRLYRARRKLEICLSRNRCNPSPAG